MILQEFVLQTNQIIKYMITLKVEQFVNISEHKNCYGQGEFAKLEGKL